MVRSIVFNDRQIDGKKAVDSNEVLGAILTDLSKSFDCVCHDLLVANLHANGLSLPGLKMI